MQRHSRGESESKKKLYWHTRFGKIEIVEQIFTQGRRGRVIRPFCDSAEVECRGCSEPLQRAITDLGADDPFAGAARKLKEHYGIEVPVSLIRALTEKHGETILASQKQGSELPDQPGVAVLIAEADGSLVPVVETAEPAEGEAGIDRRKTRQVTWKEARLCLVHAPGSVTPVFGATMGTGDQAGERLWECALDAGAGSQTKFHCLGDGASWIAEQVDLRFGAQANYLIDFFHLCEYVAAAAPVVAGKGKEPWMEEKQTWLKANRWADVLKSLQPFLESEKIPDKDAPVRACYRYIANRTHFLDYKGALAAGLPIGSGEIESAHRYVIQIRLKIAGAWWKIENASKMLALRVLRSNGEWEDYWGNQGQKAA
jgi:Uncharacterised protein family (UPF0236)